jgi:hypothetical protein
MELIIKHQERYSRLQLLLRTLFGWLYIGIPHGFLLFFFGIIAWFIMIIAFFAILITGNYPKSMFEFMAGLIRWQVRLSARIMNLSDGYPAFGVNATDDQTEFNVEYPEKLSRLHLLAKIFFGWLYCALPHGVVLGIRGFISGIIIFLAWFIVLFTGKYPEGMHKFVTGQVRWSTRLSLYLGMMTDDYPPFTGK